MRCKQLLCVGGPAKDVIRISVGLLLHHFYSRIRWGETCKTSQRSSEACVKEVRGLFLLLDRQQKILADMPYLGPRAGFVGAFFMLLDHVLQSESMLIGSLAPDKRMGRSLLMLLDGRQ